MTTIPDRWFTEPSYMLEWISQSMCLRRFVSLPTNTTVTVESLRYLSLISRNYSPKFLTASPARAI